MTLVSFCRILNGLSGEINLFGVAVLLCIQLDAFIYSNILLIFPSCDEHWGAQCSIFVKRSENLDTEHFCIFTLISNMLEEC